MTKVVFNACFGGFSLSIEAAKWIVEAHEKSTSLGFAGLSDECLAALKEGIEHAEERAGDRRGTFWNSVHAHPGVPRHHPLLVSCVEELGVKRASGGCADLRIKDLGDAYRYKINEYDGREDVVANNFEEGWTYL